MDPLLSVKSVERQYPIFGRVDPRFEKVLDAFSENFRADFEVGASTAVVLNGKPVIDLWGGYKAPDRDDPWTEDTIVNMMSNAKGVSALCVHMLAERGTVDLDAPVARYWPEFASAGKEKVLVRHVLDHRAGLPILANPLWRGAAYDWAAMIQALASQSPMYEPGTVPAYHTLTYGFLVGEIVRRVTGETIGTFLRREISQPFEIDYHIGLAADAQARCATFLMEPAYVKNPAFPNEPDKPSISAQAWLQLPADESWNSIAFRSAELPAANGHGNARALARLYGILALGGDAQGKHLIGPEAIARAKTEQWFEIDRTLERHHRVALGFVLNCPQVYMGPNLGAFGSAGAGGSMAFADPQAGIGFSYAMNKMLLRPDVSRAKRLVEAVYRCL